MAADPRNPILIDHLQKRFKDGIMATTVFKDEVTHLVAKGALVEICEHLKNDPDLQMNYMVDVVGVDYAPAAPRFEVVYHLYSIPRRHRIRLKVKVAEGERLPSVTAIWPAADFPEREVYDMYGISFDNHPNLMRIYMPHDWEGFPLRKDYPLKGYKDQYNPFGEEKEELL